MALFSKDSGPEDGDLELSRSAEEARERVRHFHSRARQGQVGLALFGAMSLAAYRYGSLLDTLPDSLRAALGAAPPTRLVSIALAVYAFSALIYILARMMEGDLRYRGWSHLGYLGGFYFFFAYCGTLQENFWAILAAGVTILLLEFYRIWSQCQEAIRLEKQTTGFDDPENKP